MKRSTPSETAMTTTVTGTGHSTLGHKAKAAFHTWRSRTFAALLFITSILAASDIKAQVARYQFSQATGVTYTSIAGTGTAMSFAGTTVLWDDNVATSPTIPFTFTFNGTGYTTCSINSNGYITFGATASSTTGYTPISATTGFAGAVVPFCRDMINSSGSTTGAGGSAIYTGVQGVAPNRTFVIEWIGARRYSGGAIVGDNLNFQIRLNETTNIVEVLYGNMAATSTTGYTIMCGLRGATNTDYNNRLIAAAAASWIKTDMGTANSSTISTTNTLMPASGTDFKWTPASCAVPTAILVPAGTVAATTATINWTASASTPSGGYEWKVVPAAAGSEAGSPVASGSVAAGVVTAGATGLSPSTAYSTYVRANCGSTFSSWAGPTNFTTAAACGAITSAAATGITLTGATANWTGGTGSYIIEYGPAGFTPGTGATAGSGSSTVVTALAGATSKAITGLSSSTSYQYYVRQVCAGPFYGANTTVQNFATLCAPITTFPFTENFNLVTTPALPPCWSANDANADGDKWITYATYGTGGTNCAGLYTDFNAGANNDYLILPQLALTGSQTLTFSVAARSSSEPNDYEVVLSTTGNAPADFTTIIKPLAAVSNTTMAAITPISLAAYTGNVYIAIHVPSGGLDGYYLYVDDVAVNTLACIFPTSYAVTGLTNTGATANWAGGSGAYVVEYGATGFTPGTGATAGTGGTVIPVSAGATSQAIGGLTANTTYDVYVRQICSGPSYSSNSAKQTFTTPCAATGVTYTQDFESVTVPAIPACTSIETISPSNAWTTATQTALGFNSKVLRYGYSTSNAANAWWYTQGINLTAGSVYRVAYKYGSAAYPENLEVKYGTAPTAASMTTGLATHTAVTTSPLTNYVDFTAPSTGVFYFGWHVYSTANQNALYLDSVVISLAPSCLNPTATAATGLTTTGATANWTSTGTGSYIIEYGAPGFTPGTGATAGTGGTVITAPAGATSASIGGLSASSTYQYYVRQVCSGPSYSTNSNSINFNTVCNVISSFPWNEGFESTAIGSGVVPNCWSVSNPSGNRTPGVDNQTYTGTTYGGARTGSKFVFTAYQDTAWIFTPSFQLTAGTTYTFSFWMMNKVPTTPVDFFVDVAYGSTNTPAAMTNALLTAYSATNSAYQQFLYTITPASTGPVTFGVRSRSASNTPWALSFDDFNVSTVPNCTGTPTAGTAAISTTGSICTGSPVTLTLSGYSTGAGGLSIQWQSKPAASGSFTDIPGATSATYTESPTASTQYRAQVKCSYTSTSANSNTITQTVNNPTITGTGGPTSICGNGTLTLTATVGTPATDTAYWYATAAATTPIGRGPSFTTPTITANTTYYVAASSGGGSAHVGPANATATSGAGAPSIFTQWGITFSSTAATTIQSVAVYPVGTGTLTISVQSCANGCSSPTIYGTYVASFTGATGTKQIVPVNISVPIGTGMKMVIQASTGLTDLYRETISASTGSFPFTASGSPITLTSSEFGGTTTGTYYFFYDWVVGSSCTGPVTAIPITYNTPPALTVSPATASICNGDSVAVTATGPAYSILTWTPAGTVTPATGANVVLKPSNTTDYVVTGTGASGGCTNTATVRVDVRATPANPTVTPGAATLCNGQSIKLRASGSALSQMDTLTSQNFNSGLAGWTVSDASYNPTASGWKLITSPYNYYGYSGPQYVNYGVTTPFSPFFITNSDTGGLGSHTTTALTSVTFPTTGYSSLKLYYRTSYMFFSGDTTWVQVSTNGTTWNTIKSYTASTTGTTITAHPPIQDSVDMTVYIGNANVQIRFFHASGYGYSWSLDNIFITGTNTTPQYTWTPATGLYTNPGLTTSYTAGAFADSVYAAPTSTTLYTTLVTNVSSGCTARDTTGITVNQPVTAVANASGNASITNAATYTLSGSATNYSSYTWSATGAGTLSGTGTLSPTYDPAVGQVGTVTITLTVNAYAPCASPKKDSMILTITPGPNNTWIGNTNDWFLASNWTSGVVPNSCGAVCIIPALTAGYVYPVIGSASAQVGNITVAANAQITVNATRSLSVCGNFNGPSGTVPASILGAGSVVFNGTTAQIIYGRDVFNTLTFNKTAGTMTISGGALVDVKTAIVMQRGDVTNSTRVSLKSDASGTAYFDNFTNSATAGVWTGSITVERFVPGTTQGYRDISSPVGGARVADWAADFAVTGTNGVYCYYAYNPYPSLQYYKENDNSVSADYYGGFISYTGLANVMAPMQGYAARLYTTPLTITTSGTPNTGAQSIAITKTTSSVATADGWNLVGNPYPSSISWNAVKTMNAGKTDGVIYRFATSGEYTGSFSTHNGTTGTLGATNEIASTQGFFVLATANNTLNMDNTVRVASTSSPFFKTADAVQPDEVRLTLSNTTDIDEVVSYTDPNTTVGFDQGYDAVKMAAGSTVYMSFDMPARELTINVMDLLNEQTVLPLRIAVTDTGSYTFRATELNLTDATLVAYLKDAETNTLYDLTTTAPVLTLNGSHFYTGRFSVVFKKKATAPTGIVTTTENTTKIYSYGNKIYIQRSSAAPATIDVTNILGQDITQVRSVTEKNEIELPGTEPWYAIVKVNEGGKITVNKVLISNK